MNKNKLAVIGVFALLLQNSAAFAKCEVIYNRTACAGKEKESYVKCDGQASCTKTEDAESEKECGEAALKACANTRFDITKSKVITAKWNGKELNSKSGPDFCVDYPNKDKEFNKCK